MRLLRQEVYLNHLQQPFACSGLKLQTHELAELLHFVDALASFKNVFVALSTNVCAADLSVVPGLQRVSR